MKLLLTSGGVRNPSIEAALVALLGKPIAESTALVIPTAEYGHPRCDPFSIRRFVVGDPGAPHLPWKALGVLDLTALPSTGADRWVPWVREADVLLVDGGDATYLGHWIRESGLLELLPSLEDTVWVGVSAGSMVMTPRIGADFTHWAPDGDDTTLGLVDFSICPHLATGDEPGNSMAEAEEWAAGIGTAAYALDDQSAIVVDDGSIEVVSEGRWRYFPHPDDATEPR